MSDSQVRRSKYIFYFSSDSKFFDILSLLQGEVRLERLSQLLALSILTGKEHALSEEEFQLLVRLPSDAWQPQSQVLENSRVSLQQFDRLVDLGLILSKRRTKHCRTLLKREEVLLSEQWNVYAALFHFMTKWRDFHLQLPYQNLGNESQEPVSATPEFYESFIEMYGKPPHHFHSVGRRSEDVLLPVPVKPGSELYELLLARGTTRQFDPDTDMGLEQLSTLLYYVFGCHGYSPVYDDIYGLKKTSPSGGGLHPVEVYPLVLRVESLDAGLYHYNVERNCLESIHKLSRETASDLANEFTAGQGYPSRAGVLFIMTARFYRNYWKYRRHNKAYSVILMDAAHLSQSLYLVCTEIGLGAFVTAAINNENIEKWLGIDGFREGAILICGCGIPTDDVSHLDPTFLPYIPPDKIKI